MAQDHGHHERFEELAVGHVLGGLDAGAAAAFRSHLAGCRDCRARVSELRDIASELAAAERDELSRARVKTEVARRPPDDPAGQPPWAVSVRPVTVVLAVASLLLLVVAFWNFHLRDQNAQLVRVTETREAVLSGLAEGRLVDADLADGVTGLVAVAGDDVVVDLAGLPRPPADTHLIVWLLGDGPSDHYWLRFRPADVPTGRLALRDPHRGRGTLVVTIEDTDEPGEPTGRELVRAELRAAGGR